MRHFRAKSQHLDTLLRTACFAFCLLFLAQVSCDLRTQKGREIQINFNYLSCLYATYGTLCYFDSLSIHLLCFAQSNLAALELDLRESGLVSLDVRRLVRQSARPRVSVQPGLHAADSGGSLRAPAKGEKTISLYCIPPFS